MTETDLLFRPRTMVRAARWGAQRYRRRRDLPSAVPGLLGRPPGEIVPTLRREEAAAEERRRAGAPGYRPARHLQLLLALLAETA